MSQTQDETGRIRADFDAIARLADAHDAPDRYEALIAGLVPAGARRVLEVGCGLGRLSARLAAPDRTVTAVDLSPEMIARASRRASGAGRLDFRCGDFLAMDLPRAGFDCVVSAATLHHMPVEPALDRMMSLLAPGGTLVIHDLRADAGLVDWMGSAVDLVAAGLERLVRTGRLRTPRAVREAWARHGAGERYMTMPDVRALAAGRLPSATVVRHRFWRYTIVWQNPARVEAVDEAVGAGER